jgi:hypothetical protein
MGEAQPVLTAEELFESIRHAPPPTADDVPVTLDGRRLDTPEKVRAWVDEVNVAREAAIARGEELF